MKKKKSLSNKTPWYHEIWETIELTNTNPELDVFFDIENNPKFQNAVTAKLVGQTLPLTPLKQLVNLSPEKLGLVLGQKYANAFNIIDYIQAISNVPGAVKRGKAMRVKMEKMARVPEIANKSMEIRFAGMFIEQFAKDLPEFETKIRHAFDVALKQPNRQEAVDFFCGFATGIATPGFKNGKIVRHTAATDLHLKMFMHSQQVRNFRTVKELRRFLLQNGFTESTLGPDSRLEKYCTRIGYAPGKRHNSSQKKK